MVARAEQYAAWAEDVRQAERASRRLRERITLCRRDVAKMIAAGLQNGVEASWQAIHATYKRILAGAKVDPQAAAEELTMLADEVFGLLETHAKMEKLSGNADHCEQHI